MSAHLRRPIGSSRSPRLSYLALLASVALGACSGGGGSPGGPGPDPTPHQPGQTDYVTEIPGQGGGPGRGADGGVSSGTGGSGGSGAGGAAGPGAGSSSAPGGRVANVEEGDIYRVDGNRLFYLNTYRGFIVYDLSDPKLPRRVSRLPVFGYPIEMFVSGNTVQALLRDALYLTQVGDQFQYERHNVSQLVTIDISDINNPRVVSTRDIQGQLREGVTRKIENTIYVVSYFPQSYYWGWRPDPSSQAKEQAWVYSFNVSDPANPVEKGRHKIFEGGSINVYDQARGTSVNRNFSGVAISATSNALMVVENWWLSWSNSNTGAGGRSGCGDQSYYSGQEAVVSLIDISDPQGTIAEHAKFHTPGQLNDQFKMTYVHDPAASTGTFYGIFSRQVWGGSNCNWTSHTQNTLESWDVSERGKPRRLDALDFGKPNEVVGGSTFDVERKVAYAITAERIDPLYAFSIADRADLKILSAIDGLSGDMSVFRLVGNRQFLLAVGRDNSETCQGQQVGERTGTRMAVSVIDVRDLAAIRLVQRKCLDIKADWIGSGVSNNLDQAHKMLGMHADGDLNILSVPVYYSKRVDNPNSWWWYRYETAVGLMTWDLRKYDPARPATEQQVIESFGSFVHPHGEVRRSILFRHQAAGAASARRMMINLSDTHASVVDLEDMRTPQVQSTIELAPYYNQIYRFGDHLVEQVQSKPGQSWWSPTQELAEFRVRKAGGDLEAAPVVARFEAAQVQRVFKHGDNLVLFRQLGSWGPNGERPTNEVQVFDLRDPSKPRQAGRVAFPAQIFSYYYPYWCGMGAYWGGYWFGQQNNFALTEQGIAFYVNDWDPEKQLPRNALVFLDLRNADAPKVSEQALPEGATWNEYGMVADPVEPRGFYVSHRKHVGTVTRGDFHYDQYRYYAQRWEPAGERWASAREINIPGHLIRTWKSADGFRMFLSQDHHYRHIPLTPPQQGVGVQVDHRLSLMRQVSVGRGGGVAAEFLDGKVLTDLYPGALMLAGDQQDKLVIGARPQLNWYGYRDPQAPAPGWEQTSDRLLVYNLAGNKLDLMYDKPTRMYGLSLMGTHRGKLFVNISGSGGFYTGGWSYVSGTGDGILIVDLGAPMSPKATRFVRTLGYASHIEFFDDEAYIASGHFGLLHVDLRAPSDIPIE